MEKIPRLRAAECVRAARTTVLEQLNVHNPPRSAGDWAFVRLYDALAENIITSGRDNVTVTYRDLAVLASHRGKGKKTKASSLRKPFSANAWRGPLLDTPFKHDGISLTLHLHPAARRGRPVILRATFDVGAAKANVEVADPNGKQPILEEARLAEEREARVSRQAGVARRFIDALRETGFERADDLSRWFARRGLHIAPSLIIAILVIALCTATAGAVVLIRYIVVHNKFRLTANPDEQGYLPAGHHSRGDLVRMEQLKGGRLEIRLAPGAIIWTFFPKDLQFTRLYPDSNLNFEWTLTINGRTIKKATTIPEVEYPDTGGMQTSVSVQPVELRIYNGSIRTPNIGEHRVDKEEDRGWISGAACVLPRPGYAPGRSSPIDAAVLPGRHVRFLIRHGPARVGDAILKFSFGDGTVWSSADQPWTISQAAGDAWDRYQTTLEHVYSRSGRYDIRFALFRDSGNGLESLREGIGQVYVDMPPPSAVPVAPGFPGYSLFVPPGTTSVQGDLTVNNEVPGSKPGFNFAFKASNRIVVPSQVLAVSVRNDPHSVALGVVPPAGIPSGLSYSAYVDYGDGGPGREFARRDYEQATYLVAFREFLRSAVYHITITAIEPSSHRELFVLRRNLQVTANAPPQITE